MHRNVMANPSLLIDQLEEALEERQSKDRRKSNVGIDPQTGEERRQEDRRNLKNTLKH